MLLICIRTCLERCQELWCDPPDKCQPLYKHRKLWCLQLETEGCGAAANETPQIHVIYLHAGEPENSSSDLPLASLK